MQATATQIQPDPKINSDKFVQKPAREYAVIRFPSKNRSQDPETVSVGVNGQKYRMQRNELIPVPVSVINVLRDAKEPVTEPENSVDKNGNIVRRRKIVTYAPRFPFELLGWIDKEHYEALRKIAMKKSLTEKEVNEVL